MNTNSMILAARKIFYPKMFFLMLLHGGAFVLGVTGVLAYSYSGYYWGGSSGMYYSASYYINSSLTSSVRTAIQSSDATWDAAGSKFRFKYKSTTTRNASKVVSGTSDGYNDVGYTNMGSTGTIASAVGGTSCPITEVDTALNSYYSWSTSGSSSAMDVQNTMTHEFGHWLNLGDLSSSSSPSYCGTSSESTMCGSASKGETRKRSLATDDKNGIKYIYGT